jgi:hypothetical protein
VHRKKNNLKDVVEEEKNLKGQNWEGNSVMK